MKASGNRICGYGATEKRVQKTPARKLRRAVNQNAEEAKAREALEAMFAAIHELLESQRRVYAGERDMDGHAAAMLKLLRYVKRKVKRTTDNAAAKPPPRRKTVRS